jgi:hypothetical protein
MRTVCQVFRGDQQETSKPDSLGFEKSKKSMGDVETQQQERNSVVASFRTSQTLPASLNIPSRMP